MGTIRQSWSELLTSTGLCLMAGCGVVAMPTAAPLATEQACIEGASCGSGLCCGGTCIDPSRDRWNCGQCGVVCSFPHACLDGLCTENVCDSGFTGGLLPEGACTDVLETGFSASENPAGSWAYGWASVRGAEFQMLSERVPGTDACGNESWTVNPGGDPPNAHVYANPTNETTHCSGTTTVEPGWFVMHPGPEGQVAIARFTASSPGSYRVQGTFSGVSGYGGSRPSSTDTSILMNNQVVYSAGVNVLGFDNMNTWTGTTSLRPGNVVDFRVGDGGNGWGFDGTRVQASVTWVGLPSMTCRVSANCESGEICVAGNCRAPACDGVNYASAAFDSPNAAVATPDSLGVRIQGASGTNAFHPVLYASGVSTSSRYVLTGSFRASERSEFGIVFGGHAYSAFLVGSDFGRVSQVWIGQFASWNPAPLFRGPSYTFVAGTYTIKVMVTDQDVRAKLWHESSSEPDWQVSGVLSRIPEGSSVGAYVYQSPDVVLTSLLLCDLSGA